MKKVKLVIAALALSMSTLFITPVQAQTGDASTTTSTDRDDAEDDDDGDAGKWGLLGLAGLLGLLPRKKHRDERTTVSHHNR